MPTITVNGRAEVRATPDISTVTVTIEIHNLDSDVAFATATRRSNAIVELLDEFDVPPEDRSTSSVRLAEHTEYDGTRHVRRGYTATITTTITLRDPEVVADLMVIVARDHPDARLDGPEWSCSGAHPARREARRLAALDARERADDYTAALGLRINSIMSIEESTSAGFSQPRRDVMYARSLAVAEDESFEIEAGSLAVNASVTIAFDAVD